jgi:site-specific DNA-cytosine methylase
MTQRSMLDFVSRKRARVMLSGDGKPKFVDLFCGIGGASEGAASAGYDVALAVDACKHALKVHKLNHPYTEHFCLSLPTRTPLPFPCVGAVWHLHGSPPCTYISNANQVRDADNTQRGLDLVDWYLRFAMDSNASSWSMEQVSTPAVKAVLQQLSARGSPYRSRLAWMEINFKNYGVPQNRKRIIAGSPTLVAKLQRLECWQQGVQDVIPAPRGTHVRNDVVWSDPRPSAPGSFHQYDYKYFGKDDCCIPIDRPAYCITARHTLRWATPRSGKKLERMTPLETALMQTFPATYKLDKKIGHAIRGIGNAMPPSIMEQLLK